MTTEYKKIQSEVEVPYVQNNDVDSCSGLVTPQINTTENDIRFNVSGEQFRQLLSAIEQGSELLYPDKKHELTEILITALSCPPAIESENGDCFNYPLYSPFITYHPYNPWNGEEVPEGYQTPPFYIHDGGSSFPPAYQNGDLIVPFSSIRLIDYTIFGQAVSIKIEVYGSGQIELDLLSVPAGGVAILKVGENPPNPLDIIAGIVNPETETIIELNLDTFQTPPEDDIVSAQEINIDAGVGVKSTVWISFLPVVDDSLLPLRYGGGIRAIQLCGFEEEGMVNGITNIRIENGQLEYFINGQWQSVGSVLENCDNVENCLSQSSTIINLQSQVADNVLNILGNDNDIINLQSQVTQNTGDIAQNTGDIAQNTGDIAQNIATIQDIKADLLELDNGSGASGDLVLIHSQVLDVDGNFDVIDVSGYDNFIILFSVGMGTSAGIYTNLIINGDTTNANYYNSIAGQYPNVARCATPSWVTLGRFTSGKIECYDTRTDGKKREITSLYVSPTIAGSYAYMYNDSMHYRVQAPIDTIELKNNNGNLSAGSSITVLGVPAKVQADGYDWQVFIDFTDDRNELLDTIVASYQLGNDRYINAENPLRRLALAWLLSEQIEHVRLTIDAELTDGVATIFTEDETGLQIEQEMVAGRHEYTFETGFTRNGFSTVARDITLPGIVYFYSIRLFGNGTIPVPLETYEVT